MNNIDEKIYIVYQHTSPSNKVYIGITKQEPEKRWQNGNGYFHNKYFSRAIQKYGWDNFEHNILYTNLTKEEAEQKEIELILHYNSTDSNYGYNIDNGGNCIGTFSEEHKQKISKALTGKPKYKIRGKNHPMYGKKLTDETKFKISLSRQGKGGHILSDKEKAHLSKTHSISVLQYDLSGVFIKEWKSASQASKELNIHRADITNCCRVRLKTAGGFIWKYKGDELKIEDLDKHKKIPYQCKKVNQYTITGEFIKSYESIKDAAIENNFNHGKGSSNILCCCKGKTKSAYGFIWKYAE